MTGRRAPAALAHGRGDGLYRFAEPPLELLAPGDPCAACGSRVCAVRSSVVCSDCTPEVFADAYTSSTDEAWSEDDHLGRTDALRDLEREHCDCAARSDGGSGHDPDCGFYIAVYNAYGPTHPLAQFADIPSTHAGGAG